MVFGATVCKTVRPMLSDHCLSVTFVHCGQTVGWIKMKNNVENTGMRVNMNKTKVMISGEWRTSEASAEGCRMVYVAEVLVVIQYNVLVVTSGYTRSVLV